MGSQRTGSVAKAEDYLKGLTLAHQIQTLPARPREPAMNIKRIETVRVQAYPNLLWVRIHSDDGLIGLGETYYQPAAVEAIIHDFAAPMLLGQCAYDRERLWQAMFCWANFFGYAGAEMR